MGFTFAIWLGCEDTSFPFTYAYIIHFFILFVNPSSHLTFHTLIFSFISTGGEKFFSPPVPFLKSNNTTFNFEYPKNSYTYHNCTYHSKNRRCDTTALVRNIPETFKGLGLSQQTAFCPQKAMLAGMILLLLNPRFN